MYREVTKMLFSIKSRGLLVLMGLVAALALTTIACGAAAPPTPQATPTPQVVEVTKEVVVTPTPAPKEPIIFSDLNWDSAQIQNRVAMFIIEHGYGYPVDTIFGDTTALWNGLLKGDTHITMEVWLPNLQEVWDKAIAEGTVIPVGRSLDNNWQSAFVIPTYVAEENPELKSVQDLRQFKDLFVTPDSKGQARLVTCIAGWECEKINEAKVKAYGLEDEVELVNPGSAAALFASLEGAYEKREPWLGYMWGPTKPAAELDLTTLEEPPYSKECWESNHACAYPTARVMIAVHPSLVIRAPEVVELLRKWDLKAQSQVAAETWMTDNNATVEEAAVWFLKNHEEVWTQWTPADVAERVKQALAQS
jgi:glycine betaine/proline transport system substrate-binding protein